MSKKRQKINEINNTLKILLIKYETYFFINNTLDIINKSIYNNIKN